MAKTRGTKKATAKRSAGKKAPANKPAAKKPAAKKPSAKKPSAKSKSAPKKPAKSMLAMHGEQFTSTEAKTPAAQAAIETQVAELLASDDAGDIDNVFDIVDELADYEKRLPKSSKLRPAWNKFYASCSEIMQEVSLGAR